MMPVRCVAALWVPFLFSSLLLSGCGNPGSPLPPSLMLPQPVADLHASRLGDTVTLRWTMPRRSTDRVLLKGDQYALVCRAVARQTCTPAGVLLLLPGTPAEFADSLPASLRRGPLELLRYEVRLRNHSMRDAGASNPAFAAGGWAPPTARVAEAVPTARGIALHWEAPAAVPDQEPAAGAQLFARIQRQRVLRPGENAGDASEKPPSGKGEAQTGVPQPMLQVLEASEHPPKTAGGAWSPASTIDADATLNRSYRYTVQLVERVVLDSHPVELSGEPARTGVVQATDTFPPAAPTDLAAVANSVAVDLAWSANAEADLAGYKVYRREVAQTTEPATLVSGSSPLPTPNWTDVSVHTGVRYSYSVSAVDASGNESPRSIEVTEALPE